MSNLQNVDLSSGGPVAGQYIQPRLAVLIPCYNEESTIATVVGDFRLALPTATIYVYDNNSTDRTIEEAKRAGAVVRSEYRQGKGQVVRRMFADIDADCYILVDGDDTYSAAAAPRAIEHVIKDSIDFVNIARISTVTEAYRLGHRFGNKMLTNMVRFFFGRQSSDMLSGYKVLSRRFVKSFPAMSSGFETETELTVHALEMRMPIAEISAPYKERPPGSFSKLSTFRDGWRILMLIARLIKDERPLKFFGTIGLLLCLLAFGLSLPLLVTYVQTGLVPRLPTAVLSVGLVITGFLTIFAGLILDVVTKARQEMKRMAYLVA
ncbi:glycosyltransferase [Rhizobium sp. P38BS-XIX]|uniref:glycosyltransferase family 2 protein n=1 Tax=Rhizobium sp. P38BS-XIX TaxID=2726740 RepID=UPI0014567E3C|nr:glycosyltransferase family 2 protein [Rhizobium sp. P38BS-XIX]NLS00440.1 glycosyltransferase [Rhizobium sp. P38BS-XIX]